MTLLGAAPRPFGFKGLVAFYLSRSYRHKLAYSNLNGYLLIRLGTYLYIGVLRQYF
jgi:hypothetical protein